MKALKLIAALVISIFVMSATPAHAETAVVVEKANGYDYLKTIMDQYNDVFYVYQDYNTAGNHFLQRAKLSSSGDQDAVPDMLEAYCQKPYLGNSCIKCVFQTKQDNWGGWYFTNGVLQGKETAPKDNHGEYKNAGVDLRGAGRLTFWVRGEKGGESVEFFCFGIGRDAETGEPVKPFPDSSYKVGGYAILSDQWEQYSIDLAGLDLRYVLGGFGWVTNSYENDGEDITFYLDEIKYDCKRPNELRFMNSFETCPLDYDFDLTTSNAAFTYDNAVALMAFLANGDNARAKLLADAFVYAQQHDRFFNDGRLRNAYQGGDLILPPGWTPFNEVGTVRLPGFYQIRSGTWAEDEFQVSTHTGNMAWVMLALMAYYQEAGGEQYLAAAQRLGEWIETNCRDERGAGGYTGGYTGNDEKMTKLTYKSTEHNIDLYAAFEQLYLLTSQAEWHNRAKHARNFVQAMWDDSEGKFWTGTDSYGVAINKKVIPLDIQAWAVLSLRDVKYFKVIDYAEKNLRVGKGFDYNEDRDGVWYEGAAQMAAAYKFTGQEAKRNALLNMLSVAQLKSGGIYAADRNYLTTGFIQPDGKNLVFMRCPHVAATAWAVLAEKGINPFWYSSN
ncbi:MAG TPA: hypothetical protein DEF34_12340 [Desulfotomaculum sp.]|nr:MAG: hypothetical protein JL56_16525 [Desulfotomaculum sp. BICA1-6]HBX24402.1 hypothetical protein [Desulfotomaculum sp.]